MAFLCDVLSGGKEVSCGDRPLGTDINGLNGLTNGWCNRGGIGAVQSLSAVSHKPSSTTKISRSLLSEKAWQAGKQVV